jgi:nucleoside-diphosphate-sugar epimerase
LDLNMAFLGALPARFRRERVLIVGCGDVGLRSARALGARAVAVVAPGVSDSMPAASQGALGRVRLFALTSTPARVAGLRAAGITPLAGNLDDPASLRRLAGLATRVLHLAPPPGTGLADPRSLALVRALARRTPPRALVYGSTSGVYGDCSGAWVDEVRAVNPGTPRARRRVAAEDLLRSWGLALGVPVGVLRIPGIYAPDREGGTPRERLLRGTPVLRREDDVHTNHVHADDLARACVRSLWRAPVQRVFNVCDDTELTMGDYFDLAADLYGLPRPERVSREQARERLSPMTLSFMGESRRLSNLRMKRELGLKLRYPQVEQGLRAA